MENKYKKYYLIMNDYGDLYTTYDSPDIFPVDSLRYAGYLQDTVLHDVNNGTVAQTPDAVIDAIIEHLTNDIVFNTAQEAEFARFNHREETRVVEVTKPELIDLLRTYDLDIVIEEILETAAKENLEEQVLAEQTINEKEKTKELDWLLNLPEGFVVAISACRGKDCSRTDELEKRLRRKNYIKVVGKWDGVEETSFLVFTESESAARTLVETGIHEFNQDDVYVWKTPMTMADITEGTNEGTRLDDKYYYFDLDKIVMKRENVIPENKNGKTLNENRREVMEKYRDIIEDVIGSVEKDPEWLDDLNMLIFDIALDHFERKENKYKAYELIAENWEIVKDQVAELDFEVDAMAAAVAPNTRIGEAIREYIKQNFE